jgi:hypothetical protein
MDLTATQQAIDATQQAIRDEFIDRMSLVLGKSYSGVLVTYHSQKKQYVLLDDHTGWEFEVLPDLVARCLYEWHCLQDRLR